MMDRYPCDTCERIGTIRDMNGSQCWSCYTPDGPHMMLTEWIDAGREPGRFTRVECYCSGPIRPDDGCPRHDAKQCDLCGVTGALPDAHGWYCQACRDADPGDS